MLYQIVGYGYTWWRGDPLPALPPLTGFEAAPADDYQLLAGLAELDVNAIVERTQDNQPYLARLYGRPVAYGWSTFRRWVAEPLGINFPLPRTDRYLWDFVTLPEWRGQGIYPRLLQAILKHEGPAVERFWIGHDAGNIASARGILKAGFQRFGYLAVLPDGSRKIVPEGPRKRAAVSPLGLQFGLAEVQNKNEV